MPETLDTTMWSLASIKAALQITTTNDDARLVRLADTACAQLEKDINRYVVARPRVEVQDGPGGRVMFLEKVPATAFTSIVILRYPSDATTDTLVNTRYNVNLRTGRVWAHNEVLNRGNGNVTFTYSPGYGDKDDQTAIPADLWQLGLDMLKYLYDQEKTGTVAASQVSIGNNTFIIKPNWPLQVQMGLKNWRSVQC
jgi:uncharacterized phiE125 gp8 family phage protein